MSSMSGRASQSGMEPPTALTEPPSAVQCCCTARTPSSAPVCSASSNEVQSNNGFTRCWSALCSLRFCAACAVRCALGVSCAFRFAFCALRDPRGSDGAARPPCTPVARPPWLAAKLPWSCCATLPAARWRHKYCRTPQLATGQSCANAVRPCQRRTGTAAWPSCESLATTRPSP